MPTATNFAPKSQEQPLSDGRQKLMDEDNYLSQKSAHVFFTTVNLALPLSRRLFKTCRPLADAIRFKKPCLRRRFFFFGCQVRFIRESIIS
jgi:hypothetical protein